MTWTNCSANSKLSKSCIISNWVCAVSKISVGFLPSEEDVRVTVLLLLLLLDADIFFGEGTGEVKESNDATDDVFLFLIPVIEDLGVEFGVVCGVLFTAATLGTSSSLLILVAEEDLWNGEAIVVAADDTKSIGKAITFLKADK